MKKSKKKNNKKKYYILCIILVIIIIIVFLIKLLNTKPVEVEVKVSALRLEETTNYNNSLKIYLDPYEYGICYDEIGMCGKEYLAIKTENEESYLLENYKFKYFFYTDGDKVKVFDTTINKSYSFEKLNSDYSLDFIIDNNDKLIGVVYSTDLNEHTSYLLIDGNEVLYKEKYDYMSSISPKYLAANKYDKDGNQIGAYVINATKEEKPLIEKEIITDDYYGFFSLGNKYITFEWDKVLEIYDNDSLELIYKTSKANKMDGYGNPRFRYSVDIKDNIYIYNDKYLSILNNKGKEIKKSSVEIPGVDLIDKYVINTSNDELTITDIDNKSYTIASLKNGIVDYYEYTNQNNKEGLLFIIYDKTLSYKEVYNSCKNTKCKGITFEEFKTDYQNQLGYEYFFDYKNFNVTKTPTVIIPEYYN